MYAPPTETTIAFLEKRFAKVPDIRDANVKAFKSGWNFGETTEVFAVQYEIKPARMTPGTYRNISGNLSRAGSIGQFGCHFRQSCFGCRHPL